MNNTLGPSAVLSRVGSTPIAPPGTRKKRYAIVGAGARAAVFTEAIATQFGDTAELVGLCDISPKRLEWHKNQLQRDFNYPAVATYPADDFETMIAEQGVEVVIVTTLDVLHHEYIIRAMNAGCDAVVEKPMTIDAEKAHAIRETMRRTGRDLRVTFNYRYQPLTTKVRELVAGGAIGKPLAVNLTYTLDTRHGANYFRRWHRDKANSGGLLVHKASHHFDLVNWMIGSVPEDVFAYGDLKFYGREAAETRGEKYDYERYTGAEASKNDPFALRLDEDAYLREFYLDAEQDGCYLRDHNVFGSGITTEDTMGVLTRYENGVIMTYSLIAYAPWEGYELYITGTKGRIEVRLQMDPHMLDDNLQMIGGLEGTSSLKLFPMFREPQEIEIPQAIGGHGGGDLIMLQELFSEESDLDDPLRHRATFRDGLASLGLGIAANESIATGKPVRVRDVVNLNEE